MKQPGKHEKMMQIITLLEHMCHVGVERVKIVQWALAYMRYGYDWV